MTVKLPEKPSDLILLALADLERVEQSPDYFVHMGSWHSPISDDDRDVCSVCWAGAVMAGTLGASHVDMIEPSDYDRYTADRLCALDQFRHGCIVLGLDEMNIDAPESLHAYAIELNAAYEENPKQWKEDMQSLAGILAAEGL